MCKTDISKQVLEAFDAIKGKTLHRGDYGMFCVKINKELESVHPKTTEYIRHVIRQQNKVETQTVVDVAESVASWYELGTIKDRDLRYDDLFVNGVSGAIFYVESTMNLGDVTKTLSCNIFDILQACDLKKKDDSIGDICPSFRNMMFSN